MTASFRRIGAARLTRQVLSTRGSRRIGRTMRLPSRRRVPVRETVPSLKASWDILELEAVRQPDTDNLSHHTGRKALPASLDHRAVSESHAAEQQVRESKGRLARESGGTDMVVAVHVLETTTAENPPGVAAGS